MYSVDIRMLRWKVLNELNNIPNSFIKIIQENPFLPPVATNWRALIVQIGFTAMRLGYSLLPSPDLTHLYFSFDT